MADAASPAERTVVASEKLMAWGTFLVVAGALSAFGFLSALTLIFHTPLHNAIDISATSGFLVGLDGIVHTVFDDVGRALLSWLILLVGIYLYCQRTPGGSMDTLPFKWLVWYAGGLLLLLLWAHDFVATLMPSSAPFMSSFAAPAPLMALWTIGLFLLFVRYGCGAIHDQYMRRYMSIWSILMLVVACTFLWSFVIWQNMQDRRDGQAGTQVYVVDRLRQMPLYAAGSLAQARAIYRVVNTYDGQALSDATRARILRSLGNDLNQMNVYTDALVLAAMTSKNLTVRPNAEMAKQVAAPAILPVDADKMFDEILSRGGAVRALLQPMAGEVAALQVSETPGPLLSPSRAADLEIAATELANTVEVAVRATVASDVTSVVMFLWLGVFYSTIVLFPWLLLLLFLFRKREARARQIINDLRMLDPSGQLLDSVWQGSPTSTAPRAASAGQHVPDTTLTERAFNNFEYVISLLLLTVLTAIGWYFVFYPVSPDVLVETLSFGANSANALSDILTKYITPISAGFVGAYFYGIQMLVRRYMTADLYPAAFLQAATRMLLVFILSLLIGVLMPLVPLLPLMGNANADAIRYVSSLLAFLAGVFPSAILSLAIKTANKAVESVFPTSTDSTPLTELDGISIWTEARLLEEQVDSVQSMAMARIELLVLRTNFPTAQLVDWIDQAILYEHAGQKGEWFQALRGAGVRTAYELLNAVGYLPWRATDPQRQNGTVHLGGQDRSRFEVLAAAVGSLGTAASATAGGGAPAGPAPADAAAKDASHPLTVDRLWTMSTSIWPERNMVYIANFYAGVTQAVTDPADERLAPVPAPPIAAPA